MAFTQKIMVVCAHPAEFCSRSGGTLIKHSKAGTRIRIVWLTHGETEESRWLYERQPGIPVTEVQKIREEEAFACAEWMGVEGKMFGFGDHPLLMTWERVEMLAREIKDFRPDIILTHWKNEITYPTHLITSESTIRAAAVAGATKDIRFFEPEIGTAARVGYIPDHYVDISAVFEEKIEALRKFESQPHLVSLYTTCNRWRGIECGCEYAEGFVRLVPSPAVQGFLEN